MHLCIHESTASHAPNNLTQYGDRMDSNFWQRQLLLLMAIPEDICTSKDIKLKNTVLRAINSRPATDRMQETCLTSAFTTVEVMRVCMHEGIVCTRDGVNLTDQRLSIQSEHNISSLSFFLCALFVFKWR